MTVVAERVVPARLGTARSFVAAAGIVASAVGSFTVWCRPRAWGERSRPAVGFRYAATGSDGDWPRCRGGRNTGDRSRCALRSMVIPLRLGTPSMRSRKSRSKILSAHLASLHESMLVGRVVGHRVVPGTDVVPQENVAYAPVVPVTIGRFQHVREEIVEHFLTLAWLELIDLHREAGIHVDHFATRDRVRETPDAKRAAVLGAALR